MPLKHASTPPLPGHLPFISSSTLRTHLAPTHPHPEDKKPLPSTPPSPIIPFGVTPSEFRLDLSRQKTRVAGLSYGVIFVILCLAGLIQCRLVTDRRTHDYSIYHASKSKRRAVKLYISSADCVQCGPTRYAAKFGCNSLNGCTKIAYKNLSSFFKRSKF